MTHELKIREKYFNPVLEGKKTFEIRNNDRDFRVNDTVILKEYNKDEKMTGRKLKVKITYITNFMQIKDYVVFGFEKVM